MLILLSDGAGLTARQCATVLGRAGGQVEALSSGGLCLARMTRHVRRVHAVPAVGRDPFGWLEAALGIAARRRADVLLPVQEQVAVMSLARERIEAAGLGIAVPEFGALAQVQDKVSAFATLSRAGLPQPTAVVAATAAELEDAAELGLPAFVKTPIGTASAGVWRVSSTDALRRLAAACEGRGVFGQGGVLVQQAVAGPLVMAQSVFARGQLVACHACQRVREGASGGASHKLGLDLPEAREHLARLGAALDWHGALSADVIVGPAGRCSSTSTRGWSSRSTRCAPASTWCGPWSKWPARARHRRSRRGSRACGRISCCWRSWARPSTAGAGASRASCATGCCTAGTTGAAARS